MSKGMRHKRRRRAEHEAGAFPTRRVNAPPTNPHAVPDSMRFPRPLRRRGRTSRWLRLAYPETHETKAPKHAAAAWLRRWFEYVGQR